MDAKVAEGMWANVMTQPFMRGVCVGRDIPTDIDRTERGRFDENVHRHVYGRTEKAVTQKAAVADFLSEWAKAMRPSEAEVRAAKRK